jgi:hypothetical protein
MRRKKIALKYEKRAIPYCPGRSYWGETMSSLEYIIDGLPWEGKYPIA